jgi:multiple sugar transport system ATP-binding protein
VVLGIRPEDMEDASLVADAPPDHRIVSTVDLVEALGSDLLVHFAIDAPPALTEDVKELAVDVDAHAVAAIEGAAGQTRSNVIARLSPRARVRPGSSIELVVDTNRLHFFDPDDGSGIYGGQESPVPLQGGSK